ncbi:MAG: GNAT family N-acetyltransferase [Paracoccaceae bacterium]
MSDIQVAPATPAHLSSILDQTRVTLQEHRARNPRAFPPKLMTKLEKRHRAAVSVELKQPISFVASLNGADAGFILLRPVADMAMIYDIGVFPVFRRQGVGRELVSHAVSIAQTREWNLLFAAVWDGNEASHQLFRGSDFIAQRSPFGALARFFPKHRVTSYAFKVAP